jgi:hypothetical protein
VDVQTAVDNFDSAMQHCDNLIAVHRAAGDGGRGRRTAETSVNRGTIVMAVAAWQAFIQDVAHALRDDAMVELEAVPAARLLVGAMRQWKADFDAAVEKFSTPGPDQTCSLLKRAGFDPRRSWTWTQKGGRGTGQQLVEPKHVSSVIEQWLRVRHDVAHGHATIHSLPVLTAVRDPASSASAKAAPTLRLTDAIDCVGFFRSVARLTADAAAAHLGTASPTWGTVPPLALGLRVSQL